MSQNVESVDSIIANRKAHKKFKRKQKILMSLLVLLIYGSLSLIGYGLYHFHLLDFKGISWKNNTLLNENELNTLLNLEDYIFQNTPSQSLLNLQNHPLIKGVELSRIGLTEWVITVEEYQVLASLNNNPKLWLLENGETFNSNSAYLDVPTISGFKSQDHQKLSEALIALKKDSLLAIDQIVINPQSFDPSYVKVFMQDGIQVSTGLKGLVVLNDYVSIVTAMNPEHRCLSIDEIRLVPYSFPCTQTLE